MHTPPALTLDEAFRPGRWTAHWIWTDAEADDRTRRTVALRRVLDLDAVPTSVPTRISALARYGLWVNGAEVSRGPIRANPRRARHDVVDLAPALRVGTNVIAATVCIYPGANPFWMPGPVFASRLGRGGFVLEAAPSSGIDLVSDERWQAQLLDGWTNGSGPVGISARARELIDLRSLPADWLDAEVDLDWPAAVVVNAMGHGEPGRTEPPNHPYGPFGPNPVERAGRDRGGAAPRSARTCGRPSASRSARSCSTSTGRPARSSTSPRSNGRGTARSSPTRSGSAPPSRSTASRRSIETMDLYGVSAVDVQVEGGAAVHGIGVRTRLFPTTRRGVVLVLGPAARSDLAGRPAHGLHLLARRLRRLPHPRAAGVDRRLGRPPDGRPHDQHRLEPGPLAPAC